jgi:tRNA (cytidine/uridine-2'-O-)-methyltransferase
VGNLAQNIARGMLHVREGPGLVRIALYQPDIPQNAGTIMRTAACLGIGVDFIGPAGFDLSDRALRRAGLDYLEHVAIARHESFEAFLAWRSAAGAPRLVLATTIAEHSYRDFAFEASDILLMGRESAGVPDAVHAAADARIRVPIRPGLRSLNVAIAAAMILGEACRQIERP